MTVEFTITGKRKWCAWDTNPDLEDGRCRQIHWAMGARTGAGL